MLKFLLIIFSVFLISESSTTASDADSEKLIVYLTWNNHDTSTSISINYYHKFLYFNQANIYYDIVSKSGRSKDYSFSKEGSSWEVRGLKRQINSITLKYLTPNKTYYFVVGNNKIGFSKEMKFKTLPNDGSPVRFVTGGDMGVKKIMANMLQSAALMRPMAALIGGDVAYADAKIDNYGKWDQFLTMYQKSMVTPEGHSIPLILAMGNHESTLFSWEAPFYRDLFRQHGRRTYFKRDLGKYANVYVLDSGHGASHKSQEQWLYYEMQRDQSVKHKMALYHVPLYPSVRSYEEFWSVWGRAYWGPSFDKFGLKAAFENHDHALKRTKRIKAEEVVEKGGTIYFGDGCWGKSTRDVDYELRWYLDKAESKRHFWVVDITKENIRARAIGEEGSLLDDVSF